MDCLGAGGREKQGKEIKRSTNLRALQVVGAFQILSTSRSLSFRIQIILK